MFDSIISINIAKAQQLVLKMISKGIKRPFMFWSAPGIGKSDVIRLIAHAIGYELVDIRLSYFNPIDLHGLPVPDIEKEVVKFIRPKFLPTGKKKLILFDELAAAPHSVQVAAYQLMLDRKLGEYQLPDDCIVMAASNPEGEGLCHSMLKPLVSRFAAHLYINPDLNAWLEGYAHPNHIDPRIIAYLTCFPQHIYTEQDDSQNIAYACPRSWAALDEMIKGETDMEEIRPLINGCVGTATASLFIEHAKLADQVPNPETILAGGAFDYPATPEILSHTVVAMTNLAKSREQSSDIHAMLDFAINMPTHMADHAIAVVRNIFTAFADRQQQIVNAPNFNTFIEMFGDLVPSK